MNKLTKITNMVNWSVYYVNNRDNCKDETDKILFDLVQERNSVVTMGKITAWPENKFNEVEKIEYKKYGLNNTFFVGGNND